LALAVEIQINIREGISNGIRNHAG